ncbi:uncharacterized protein LOC127254796 [Andrographis paniculata]|uniref:uncharacterized protein LOC127254796 n=1 Tax=Andrographis paniculata TaxID=175694 RepID=UPI0021E8752A|nr:uncharacterized protein LOC127254796 [Andrographis paniculata]
MWRATLQQQQRCTYCHTISIAFAAHFLSSSPRELGKGSPPMALPAAAGLHGTGKATAPSLPPGNYSVAGLRLPADRFALKSSFSAPSLHLFMPSQSQSQVASTSPATAPKFSMRVASKQAYVCRDCGYIYNDRTPFEKLPDKYFCPVCGAPKRRFKQYTPAVSKNANETDVRKARKAQLQRDESIGKALPFAVALGAAALAALYFYLNSAY